MAFKKFIAQIVLILPWLGVLPAAAIDLQTTQITVVNQWNLNIGVSVGRPHQIAVNVYNNDEYPAGPFTLQFFADSELICEMTAEQPLPMTLPPFGQQYYYCPWTPLSGALPIALSAKVIPNPAQVDSNPANNEIQTLLWVNGPAPVTRKVFVLVFDPIFADGKRLTESTFDRPALRSLQGPWNSIPMDQRVQEVMDFFRRADVSGGKINYVLANPGFQAENRFPPLVNGFTHTESSYRACLQHESNCPDVSADYRWILNHYQICERFNAGEIDELWMYGGPYFQFNESRLAGGGFEGYNYNGDPVTGTACRKLLPIMGFSYEEFVNINYLVPSRAAHNYGHRTEFTMDKVYEAETAIGLTNTAWHKFFRTRAHGTLPVAGASGCGNTHYPPNATDLDAHEYGYVVEPDVMPAQNSFCDTFFLYPELPDPATSSTAVDCNAWGCTEHGYPEYAGTFGTLGYYAYWFNHLPRATGIGQDGKLNDWLAYLLDPNLVIENTAKPDFRIDSLTLTDIASGTQTTRPEIGHSYRVSVDIRNASTLSADSGFAQIELRVNSVRLCPNITMPIMNGNQHQLHSCTWSATTAGYVNIAAVADVTDTVWESDENNNELTLSVPVTDPRPELNVRAIWVTDSLGRTVTQLAPSRQYKVKVAIRNTGSATIAAGAFKDEIRRVLAGTNTYLLCSGSNPIALASQQEYVRTCSFGSSPFYQEIYRFRANVDIESKITEINEGNNSAETVVTQGYN